MSRRQSGVRLRGRHCLIKWAARRSGNFGSSGRAFQDAATFALGFDLKDVNSRSSRRWVRSSGGAVLGMLNRQHGKVSVLRGMSGRAIEPAGIAMLMPSSGAQGSAGWVRACQQADVADFIS